MSVLRELNLAQNRFKQFPFTNFEGKQVNLRVLDLSRNQIKLPYPDKDSLLKFQIFVNLRELDLSSNLLEAIPEGMAALKELRELRLINNRIKHFPLSLLEPENKGKSAKVWSRLTQKLEVLILNDNPLESLPSQIYHLRELRILGMASTKIKELPHQVMKMNLSQLLVHDTNLVTPKLSIAIRGFETIKEFFINQQMRTHGRDSDNEVSQESEEETKSIPVVPTLARKLVTNLASATRQKLESDDEKTRQEKQDRMNIVWQSAPIVSDTSHAQPEFEDKPTLSKFPKSVADMQQFLQHADQVMFKSPYNAHLANVRF